MRVKFKRLISLCLSLILVISLIPSTGLQKVEASTASSAASGVSGGGPAQVCIGGYGFRLYLVPITSNQALLNRENEAKTQIKDDYFFSANYDDTDAIASYTLRRNVSNSSYATNRVLDKYAHLTGVYYYTDYKGGQSDGTKISTVVAANSNFPADHYSSNVNKDRFTFNTAANNIGSLVNVDGGFLLKKVMIDKKRVNVGDGSQSAHFLNGDTLNFDNLKSAFNNIDNYYFANQENFNELLNWFIKNKVENIVKSSKKYKFKDGITTIDNSMCYRDYYLVVEPVSYWYKSGQINNLVAITWQNVIYQSYHDISYDNINYLKNNFFPQNKYNYKRDDTNAERGYQRGCSGIWQNTFKGDGEAKDSDGNENLDGYDVLDSDGHSSSVEDSELNSGKDSAGFFILGGLQSSDDSSEKLNATACNVSVWYNSSEANKKAGDNANKSVFDYGSRTNLVNSEAISKQINDIAEKKRENKEFSDSSLYTSASSNKFKTPTAMERTLGLSNRQGDGLNSKYKLISAASCSLKLSNDTTTVSALENYLNDFSSSKLGATWKVNNSEDKSKLSVGNYYDFDSVYFRKEEQGNVIKYINIVNKEDEDNDYYDTDGNAIENPSSAQMLAKAIQTEIQNKVDDKKSNKKSKISSLVNSSNDAFNTLVDNSSSVESGNLIFGKTVQARGIANDTGNTTVGENLETLNEIKKSGKADKSTISTSSAQVPISFSMYVKYPDITTNVVRLKSSYKNGKYTCEVEEYERFGDNFEVAGTKENDKDSKDDKIYKYKEYSYSVDDSKEVEFEDSDVYVIAVKKGYISNLDSTIKELTGILADKNPSEIVNIFEEYFKDKKMHMEITESTKKTPSINLGAYKEDVIIDSNGNTISEINGAVSNEAKDAWYKNASFDGYDVFILSYDGAIESEATVELADYELNKVIPNVTNTAYSVMKNKVIDNNKVIAYVRPDLASVTVTDASSGGSMIKNTKKVYNYSNNTKLFGKDIESVFSDKTSFNFPGTHPRRNSFVSNKIYALTYSGIFSRSSFGDNKVISTISQNTDGDTITSALELLGLTKGIKPIDKNYDGFSADVRVLNGGDYIKKFGTNDRLALFDNFKFTSGTDKLGLAFNYGSTEHSVIYTNNFISRINQQARIYKTDTIASSFSGDKDKIAKVDTSDFATKDGLGIKGNMITKEYKDIVLKYYPEVPMIYYKPNIANNTFKDYATGTIKVMGDVQRSSHARSLYFFSTQKDDAKYTGTIFSDGMISNSKNNKPTIYAGSDITLKVDDKNSDDTAINIYGYSVDLINNNEELKYVKANNDSVEVKYKDIVNSGADIYGAWGNSYTKTNLKTDFTNFTNLFKNKNNYNLGIKLEVSGGNNATKKYNNFAGTIGKVESSGDATAEYVYPIGIKNGKVVTDESVYGQGYKHLCEQIEADYHAKAGQGATILENSGILQGVIDSIESSDKDYNNSQPYGDLGSSNKKADGSPDGHWYDEEVNTIVIRRYKCEGIKVSGITVQDKIDIDTVSNGDKPAQGKWYLDLSLKKNALKDWGITDEFELTTNSLINNTEFLIPSKTTQDMN